jgi:CTP:molybdopterin cytidylyltransferase MocA
VAVLLTGVSSRENALFRRLAARALWETRRRDPRWGDPHVPVRVAATADVAKGPYWAIACEGAPGHRSVPVPRVCGVLLAAGTGTRFGPSAPGGSKLLSRWRRRSLVARAARVWEAAGFAQQIVVTGHARAAVEAELGSRGGGAGSASRVIVRNPHAARGLGSSVRLAARRAPADMGLLFGHADMPRVSTATLRRIAALGVTLRDWIIVPTVRGRPVHPVFFPAWSRRELARLPDTSGGRRVIAAHPGRVMRVPMDDRAGEFVDVDRPADLRRLGAARGARLGTVPVTRKASHGA